MAELHRPRCYLDVEIEEEHVGRIVIELFSDVCPITCENFRLLCTGEKGTSSKPLCYKGTPFHRIIKGFMVQAGDFEYGNGTGGESIYGGVFDDENFDISHDQPFLVSMANKGKNSNGSQFFVSLQPNPHLDGKHTVFGKIISGHDVLSSIENLKTDQNSKPLKDVLISHCGELVLKSEKKKKKKRKASTSSPPSSSEEEGEKRRRRKKKKHKHDKKNSRIHNMSIKKEEEEEDEGPICSIDPDEIPSIPANNFLLRRTSPVGDFGRNTPRMRDSFNYKRRQSKSGRKVKGRGNIRYRTPDSDERSGSETPPHWKMAQSRLKNLKDVIPKKVIEESDSDITPTEGFEENNQRNPVLQSRLGLMLSESNKKDARRNITENRKRDLSPEVSSRQNHREGGRSIKSHQIFKELLDSEPRRSDKWHPEDDSRRNHSPLRSKVVMKSCIATRISREREVEDWKHNDRHSRRDIADRKRHSPHIDSGFARNSRKTRRPEELPPKVTTVEKPKPTRKAMQRLNVLQDDLFRYTKKKPKNKPEEQKKTDMPRTSETRSLHKKTENHQKKDESSDTLQTDLFGYTKKKKTEIKKKLELPSTSEKMQNTQDGGTSVEAEGIQKSLVDVELFKTAVEIPFLETPSENIYENSHNSTSKNQEDLCAPVEKGDSDIEILNSEVVITLESETFKQSINEIQHIPLSPSPQRSISPDIIPLPDVKVSSESTINEADSTIDNGAIKEVEIIENENVVSVSSSNASQRDKSPDKSHTKVSKASHRFSRSPSQEPSKSHKSHDKSPSSHVKQSSSRKSPVKRKSSNQRSKSHSRSRSRSVQRSTSRNRGRMRRYSRSPDVRQRRSRSPPRNSGRGIRSHRFSGGRNEPDRRGSFQRRYSRASPYRGRPRGRHSDSHSRSRSVDKRRRRRHSRSSSSSSSSSSSHSEKKKKITKGRKRRSSSSSSSSSRSKRSDSN